MSTAGKQSCLLSALSKGTDTKERVRIRPEHHKAANEVESQAKAK